MVYSLMYVRQIAVYTVGKNDEKAISEYVRNFDAASPKCIADEKRFLTAMGKDKTLSEQRQRYREENYYIDQYLLDIYRKDLYRILFSDKRKDVNKAAYDYITRNIDNWIKSATSETEESVREGTIFTNPVKDFKAKYGISINTNGIASAIQDIAVQPHGKRIMFEQYYKVIFQSLYSQTDKKTVSLAEFAKDYECVISSIRVAETGKDMMPKLDESYAYGGMSYDKLQNFLLDIKKEECNYTLQARQGSCGVKDENIADHYKEQIANKLKENCSDREKLAVCMADLNAMKEHYNSKSIVYKISSFFKARKEAKEIAQIQMMLVDKFGMEKVSKFSGKEDIYDDTFEEQKAQIQEMCHKIGEEQKADWLIMDEDKLMQRVSISAAEPEKITDKQITDDPVHSSLNRK